MLNSKRRKQNASAVPLQLVKDPLNASNSMQSPVTVGIRPDLLARKLLSAGRSRVSSEPGASPPYTERRLSEEVLAGCYPYHSVYRLIHFYEA